MHLQHVPRQCEQCEIAIPIGSELAVPAAVQTAIADVPTEDTLPAAGTDTACANSSTPSTEIAAGSLGSSLCFPVLLRQAGLPALDQRAVHKILTSECHLTPYLVSLPTL